jgi:succinate dehydrogenase/fumarate reductase flavoprotein subunit
MNYDLVILGGGLAGLFAAARASELGIKKIGLFEKGRHLGGNGRLCRTFVSSALSDFGNYDSNENDIKLYHHAMNQLHHVANPEVVQRYLFSAKRVARWLEDRKLNEQWQHIPAGANPHLEGDGSVNLEARKKGARLGALVCDVLITECQASPAVEIHMNAPGIKLLTDKEGNVNGAVVRLDGKETKIYGKKLILACGGAGGAFESLYKYLPDYMAPGDDMLIFGVPTCSGDGIAMAEVLGAEVGKEMNIHLLGPSYAILSGPIFDINTDPRGLMVNKNGLRVMDETFFYDARPIAHRSPKKVLYTVLGAGLFDILWKEKGDGTPVSELPNKYAGEINKGYLHIAKDLDEAAEFIGCDVRKLRESIERYEASCKASYDSHMLKDSEYLVSLGGAPYYIIYNVRAIDSTQGGITINRDFEAVTPEGKTIGGMYVVGDHATGFVSEYYGPGGAGMTWAMVSGFLSAESTAEYLKKINK